MVGENHSSTTCDKPLVVFTFMFDFECLTVDVAAISRSEDLKLALSGAHAEGPSVRLFVGIYCNLRCRVVERQGLDIAHVFSEADHVAHAVRGDVHAHNYAIVIFVIVGEVRL